MRKRGAVDGPIAGGFTTGMAELLLARAHDERTALLFGTRRWSWREFVHAAAARAAIALEQRSPGPFHIGLLMDNQPEYLFWLAGAALSGATVVGINPTRRGSELAADIAHADCQLYVTDPAGAATLAGVLPDLPAGRVLDVESPSYEQLVMAQRSAGSFTAPDPATLLMLLFTSGSTSAPKLVKCTTGRLAYLGARAAERYEFSPDDVCYCAMPLFHGNATMGVWAPAVTVGAAMALAPRFSARAFLPDIQRYKATFFNYVGKSLSYILATAERPDERDNQLRLGYGTEASWKDIETFTRRFGCPLIEGFGMSEGGGLQIRWSPEGPRDSIGKPAFPTIRIVDPETGTECPPAHVRCRRSPHQRRAGHRRARQHRRRWPCSRGTTAIPKPRPSARAVDGSGRATSPTATSTGGTTSPAEPATGCASTARISPPRPSSASSSAIRWCGEPPCTRCLIRRAATPSWQRWS